MSISRFPLSTDQLELLLAFDQATGLSELATIMARDPSVISRQLQRLCETHPVIAKEKGKWALTELGRVVNELTRKSLAEYNVSLKLSKKFFSFKNSALLVINAQKGLLASKSPRSNLSAEKNIYRLLKHWRKLGGRIIHVQHLSTLDDSLFSRRSSGADFLDELHPEENEMVIQKYFSSSFGHTNLDTILEHYNVSQLFLTGFTADECIEATAKDAFDKGLSCAVIGDGTALFDLTGPGQKLYQAMKIHDLILANINARYATVMATDELIALLS